MAYTLVDCHEVSCTNNTNFSAILPTLGCWRRIANLDRHNIRSIFCSESLCSLSVVRLFAIHGATLHLHLYRRPFRTCTCPTLVGTKLNAPFIKTSPVMNPRKVLHSKGALCNHIRCPPQVKW